MHSDTPLPPADPASAALRGGTGWRLGLALPLALLALVACIAGGVGYSLVQQRTQLLARTTQNAQNLARVMEEQTRGSVNAVDVSLLGLARYLPQLPGFGQVGHADMQALLQAQLPQLPFVRAIWVLNAAGSMQHHSAGDFLNSNFAQRTYFTAQRDDPALGLYVGPPITNSKGVWFVGVSRRINHADGRFAGVVVAAVEPLYFERLYASVQIGQTGNVSLLTSDARLVARVPPADHLRGQPVGGTTIAPLLALAARDGVYEAASSVDGVRRVHAYRKVTGQPFVVVVGLGLNEALANWRSTSVAVGLGTLAFCLLVAGLGGLVLRQLARARALNIRLRSAQQQAQAAAHDNAALLDAIPDLLFEVGLDGRILGYRAHQTDLLAAPPAVFLGHLMQEVLPPQAGATCMASLYQAHAEGASSGYQIELDVPGGHKWFELSVARKGGAPADAPRFVMLSRDITERKRAQLDLEAANRELKRSNADLEQFAYAASHDLIEPLRSVTSSVQLLQKRYGGQLDARADEFIAHAVGGCQRMLALITDLLTFSRLNTGIPELAPVSMDAALDTACANLHSALAESQARLTHDPLPPVHADGSQMTQLLQNLVGNAVKFRGSQAAVVHVGVRQQEAVWVFSVADQGIGIASQHFARIFELFKRLHTRDEYPGTGVGLTLCKKIVERHGGRIWVESVPGQGTTVYFTLPVVHAIGSRLGD